MNLHNTGAFQNVVDRIEFNCNAFAIRQMKILRVIENTKQTIFYTGRFQSRSKFIFHIRSSGNPTLYEIIFNNVFSEETTVFQIVMVSFLM